MEGQGIWQRMEAQLAALPDRNRRLLLHCCCAPCASHCLEFLRPYFRITAFFYNPNITEEGEYRRRAEELKRLVGLLNRDDAGGGPIAYLEGEYGPQRFFQTAKGLEGCPEGGMRCRACFRLRLQETALAARDGGFDFFTTTLSISPRKDSAALNEIGLQCQAASGVEWLYSDFKKRGGYQHSIELSRRYGLYRQDYCGCRFSLKERKARKAERQTEQRESEGQTELRESEGRAEPRESERPDGSEEG